MSDEWKLIETAPKDYMKPVLGAWKFSDSAWTMQTVYRKGRDWIANWDHRPVNPTHWRPLPSPPSQEGTK